MGGQPDRRGHRVRGPRLGRRGVPRAGAERRRLLPAAARILRAGPRDLRRVRRAAGLRRGDLRVRPHRFDVRLQRLRLRARHHHLRQGPDLGLLPDRRDDRHRPAVRAVQRRPDDVFAHGYTFGGHPVSAAVALANLDIFEREGINDHVKQTAPAFRATLEKLLDLPIVGDVRGEGFFYGIELVKDKATKEIFDDELVRAAAAQLPVRRAVRGRAVLPRRRPRRLGGAAGPAADQRPGGVRRDRGDPARRAHPGLGPPADSWRCLACHKPRRSTRSGGSRRRSSRCPSSGRRELTRRCPFRASSPRTSSSTPTARCGPVWSTAASSASTATAGRRWSADTGRPPAGDDVARDGRLLICDQPARPAGDGPRHRRDRGAGRDR